MGTSFHRCPPPRVPRPLPRDTATLRALPRYSRGPIQEEQLKAMVKRARLMANDGNLAGVAQALCSGFLDGSCRIFSYTPLNTTQAVVAMAQALQDFWGNGLRSDQRIINLVTLGTKFAQLAIPCIFTTSDFSDYSGLGVWTMSVDLTQHANDTIFRCAFVTPQGVTSDSIYNWDHRASYKTLKELLEFQAPEPVVQPAEPSPASKRRRVCLETVWE